MNKVLMLVSFLLIVGALLLFNSTAVYADSYTVTSLGNFDFVNGPDGYSGTGTRLGNFYFYNDNR